MSDQQKVLADLYFKSGTVKFGAFKLAAHEANPDLPLSPVYLHYPKPGEDGEELLQDIYDKVGELFFEIVTKNKLGYDRITGIPEGAKPLAENLAKRCDGWPKNLVEFTKKVDESGSRSFHGPSKGEYQKGENLLIVEDHTSGGYNKSLFVAAAKDSGLVVTDILTVVDREQGGVSYLESIGIKMHSIFTLSNLLKYYVENGDIEKQKADEVKLYIRDNQIKV